MKISAYLYVNRGEDYSLPYLECIRSVLWCDEIIIGTDTRFRDGTYEKLLEFKHENSFHKNHIVIYTNNFNYNSINPHGIIKQHLRDRCTGDWLLELDADELFISNNDIEPRCLIENLSPSTYLVSIPVINFFNGDNLHQEMQKTRECLSENIDTFRHHLDDGTNVYGRMGSTLIDVCAKNSGYSIYESAIEYIDVGYIYHYGWYSLPRKWEMKQTLHYYNGRLDHKYKDLNGYVLNLDDEPVDFFGPVDIRPLEYYYHAIIQEMNQASLIKFDGKHPDYMNNWLELQRVV